MQIKNSVKGSIIKYDKTSIGQNLDDILIKRFGDDINLDETIDDLHDPYLLLDMDKAVNRIKKAHKDKERVMIFGDYDVDGVTSTSILMHFFAKIGLTATYRLPDRVKDGYGLKTYFADEAKELWVTLIITVDCGTRDIEVVKHAKELGVDVIITDHHAVPEEIPKEAVALINPKRSECKYSYKNLAGAGVAFKLMQALAHEFMDEKEAKEYIQNSIDIAAVGTVADCMVLTGENRIIVKEGLKQIKRSRSRGLRKIIEDRLNDDLDGDIFGFQIGPRLNAAGRMWTAYKAVNLILNNSDSVMQTISEIEKMNEERKYLTKEFTQEALGKINRQDNLLFYVSKDIIHGIIGIVAGRITEQFYKPCIALKDEGDKLVASCRAPEYFSMIELLDKFSDLMIGYGGHKQAAWFSIKKENFHEFRTRLLAEVNRQDFSRHKRVVQIDKVIRLEELGFWFLSKVNVYKPFGMGNPKPLFMVENLNYEKLEFLWKGRDHMKFTTKHGFKIFCFFMWDHYEAIKRGNGVDIIFDLAEDSWMGKKNLMLKVVDIVVH